MSSLLQLAKLRARSEEIPWSRLSEPFCWSQLSTCPVAAGLCCFTVTELLLGCLSRTSTRGNKLFQRPLCLLQRNALRDWENMACRKG